MLVTRMGRRTRVALVGVATALVVTVVPGAVGSASAGPVAAGPAVGVPRVAAGGVSVEVGSRAVVAAVAAATKPRIRLSSVGRYVRVNLDPNLSGTKSWTFIVRRSPLASGKPYVTVGTYRTLGSHERRSLVLPRGDYRVIVPAQHGRARAVSFLRHRADVTPGAVRPSSPGRITLGLPRESRGLVVLTGRATDSQSGVARVEVWRGTTRLGLGRFSPRPPSRTRSVAWEWRGMVPGDWRTLKVRTVDSSGNRSAFVAVALEVAPTSSTRWAQVSGVGGPWSGSAGCGITTTGAAYCWGGTDDPAASDIPVPIPGLSSDVRSVSGSRARGCAVTAADELWCWGEGILGDGSATGSSVPVQVTGIPAVAEVSVGRSHTCARAVAGAAYCWGRNHGGRLGNGTTVDSLVPVPVTGLGAGTTAQVRAGDYRTCALTTAGAVLCWGYDYFSYGDDAVWPLSLVPLAIPGLGSGMVELSLDSNVACAISAAGKAWCWGSNADDDDAYFDSPVAAPFPMTGVNARLVDIATSYDTTCATTTTGAVHCWQWDLSESLSSVAPAPRRVVGLGADVVALSPYCVLTADGSAYCWTPRSPYWDRVWFDPPTDMFLDLVEVPDPA
jgi:hypothetical protein